MPRWWEGPAPGGSAKDQFRKGMRELDKVVPRRLTYGERGQPGPAPDVALAQGPPVVGPVEGAEQARQAQVAAGQEMVEPFTQAAPVPPLPVAAPDLPAGLEFPAQGPPQPVPDRPPLPPRTTYDEQGNVVPLAPELGARYIEEARGRIREGYEAPRRRAAGLEPVPTVPEAPWAAIRRDIIESTELPEGTAPREAAERALKEFGEAGGRLLSYTSPAFRQAEKESGFVNALGQVLGTGMAILNEPALAVKTGLASNVLGEEVREAGLSVDEWYPLTESGYSFLVDDIDGALFNTAEGNDVAEAVQRVRNGERAEDVAAEYYNTWAELGGEIVLDPFNLLDVLAIVGKAGKAGKFARHADDVLAAVPDLNKRKAAELFDMASALQRSADSQGDEVAKAITDIAVAAGQRADTGIVSKVADAFRKPFDLIPAAKVERDAQDIWIAAQNVFGGARSPEDVQGLARLWIENPDELARTFGRSVQGAHGQKARMVLEQLGESLGKFDSLKVVEGEQVNPGAFLVELIEKSDEMLRAGYGVTEPGRYLRFAQAAKGLMSEFYLNPVFSPGFATRQLMSDIFVTLWEGVNPFKGRRYADDFLDRFGVTSKRVVTEGKGMREFLTGVPEGTSRLPWLMGRASKWGQELARRGDVLGIPIGEESRYRRVFAELLEQAYNQNALSYTPDVPDEVVQAIGRQAADDLRLRIAMELDEKAKLDLVERALAGERGATLEPLKYLDYRERSRIPHELYRELTQKLDGLPADATEADIARIFEDLKAQVGDAVNQRYADVEGVPTATSLDANEADAAQGLLDDLAEAVARSTGQAPPPPAPGVYNDVVDMTVPEHIDELLNKVPENRTPEDLDVLNDWWANRGQPQAPPPQAPDLASQYREAVERIRQGEAEADAARDAMVEAVVQHRQPEGLEIVIGAYNDVETMIDAVRQELGELMGEVARAVQDDASLGDELWPVYFQEANQQWADFAQRRLTRMNRATEQVGELARGVALEDIADLDLSLTSAGERRLWEVSQVVEPPEGAAPGLQYVPGSVSDPEDAAKFNEFLESQRQPMDVARTNAFRELVTTHPDDYGPALDVINGTAADVDRAGAAAAADVKVAREKALADAAARRQRGGEGWGSAVKRIWEKYYGIRNDRWKEYFQQAENRWKLATADLGYQNLGKQVGQMGPIPGDVDLIRSALAKTPGGRTPQEVEALARRDRAVKRVAVEGVRQAGLPMTREQFAADLVDVMGLEQAEAEAVLRLADARARSWASRTGGSPADWYTDRLGGLERGGAGELAQEAAAATGIRAKGATQFLADNRAIIRAFDDADVSTMVHELGHVFRRELSGADANIATQWATGAVGRTWDEAAEERFARAFERYLADGVAPTEEMAGVFEQFKQWLTSIYRAIAGSDIDVNVSDEMKGVFDRLLMEAPPEAELDVTQFLRDAPTAGASRTDIPLTIDEANEFFGEDPEGLLRGIEKQAQQYEELSTAEGVRSKAERESWYKLPEPKWVEVGGYQREVTKGRRRSKEAQRVAFWDLMGIDAPPKGDKAALADARAAAKEFRERQAVLAEWHYDLADAVSEGRPTPPVPDEIVEMAQEGLEDVGELYQRSPYEGSPEFNARFGNSQVVDEQGRPLVVYHGTRSPVDFDPSEFGALPSVEDEWGEVVDLVEWSGSPDTFIGTHFAEEPEVASAFAGGEPLGARDWRARRQDFEDIAEYAEIDAQREAGPRVVPAYLNIENPIRFDNETDWTRYMMDQDMGHSTDIDARANPWAYENDSTEAEFWRRYDEDPEFRIEQNEEEVMTPIEEPYSSMNRYFAEELGSGLEAKLRAEGYDGVRYKNDVEGGWSWIALDSNQIISPAEDLRPRGAGLPQPPAAGRQMGMFEQGEDLPLFSGAAQQAYLDEYVPREQGVQPSLPGMERSPEDIANAERAYRNKRKPPADAPPGQQMLFQSQQPGNTKGAGLTPKMAEAAQRETTAMLDKMQAGILDEWAAGWQPQIVDDATKDIANAWYKTEVLPGHRDLRTALIQYAAKSSDNILLDYSRRNKLDEYLSYFVPYSYWYTRTGANWAKRLTRRPAVLSHYLRTKDALREENQAQGRRQRFAGMFPISAPWLPEWMGETLFVDPISFMVPFASFDRYNWSDPEDSQKGLQAFYAGVNRSGLRLYPWWEAAYQGGFAQRAGQAMGMPEQQAEEYLGPEIPGNFGFMLPMTRQIRAATAGQEWAPPMGVNIEAPFRQLAGFPGGEVWDPYRTNRMLANMAAEGGAQDLGLTRTALMAQALNTAWAEGGQAGTPWVPGDQVALDLQVQHGWSPDETAAAQQMLSDAMTRAAQEQGVTTAGYTVGPRMAIEPAGEARQMELSQMLGEAAWVPGGEGSREAYEQIRDQYPAIRPRQQQYGVIEERQGLQPAEMANYLAQRQAKEQVNTRYDTAVDEYLRQRPWDLKGSREVNEARFTEIARAKERFPVPEMGQFPPTRYGMDPAEQWDALAEDSFWDWKETKPAYNDSPDYAAYEKAVEKWEGKFPQTFGFGLPQGGSYAGLSPLQAYHRWEQRNDTPFQALAEVYGDVVVGPTWDRYHAAKAAGEQYSSRWPRIVGAVGPMDAAQLAPYVVQAYPGRWSQEELQQLYSGVTFPALVDQLD